MTNIGAGIVGGIIGGIAFGGMMQLMVAPTPEGSEVPMMTMIAMVLGSTSLVVGWLYHLFNSAVIGAIFGALAKNKVRDYSAGFSWGLVYGAAWWVLGGLILMPVLLDNGIFAPLLMEPMRPVAWGSLVGHLVYGSILGISYVAIRRQTAKKVEQDRQAKSAA